MIEGELDSHLCYTKHFQKTTSCYRSGFKNILFILSEYFLDSHNDSNK